ncbi:hypothetical protein M0M57_03200 [Flavobacterium azooxidireducens]|uniref:Uncharacterized protein n=1 Tax=Flavobacterium azooxidireducens TaxID=1871076 RepID=A0ABY4KGC2_9FLAO|nr:hypothetical protein [Flavobacterium azooxidireducens]UPQ79847.1 hypothetical protein M0M57_03200 [Flavobacterium azooxidireducens]
MKNILIIPLLFFVISNAQNSSISSDVKSAEISNPNSLSLLDNTATIVSSNPNIKEFSLNTENLSRISFEYTFFINKSYKNITGLEYYGLGDDTLDLKQFTMRKIHRLNLSGALNQTDSITTAAIGLNINLFTLYSKSNANLSKSYQNFKKSIATLSNLAHSQLIDEGKNMSDPDFSTLKLERMEKIKLEFDDEFADILKKPLLTLDAAAAYSQLFPTNTFDVNQQDRIGVWSTLTFALNTSKDKKKKHFINAYLFTRYINDKSVYNAVNDNYQDNTNFFDNGGKVKFEINKFSIAYEYITRNGDYSDYRSVGNIQYKINDSFYVVGGFGKNFKSESNQDLLTIIGIKWGINEKNTITW